MTISEEVRREAVEAFHEYERVFIGRFVRKPGWRLDAAPLYGVINSGNEGLVREFTNELRREAAELSNATIAW